MPQLERVLSLREVMSKKNSMLVIGNIRSKKKYIRVDDMPFGYSITIAHFENDNIVMRVNVRTPNGIKEILRLTLSEPVLSNQLSVIDKALKIIKFVKEKYGLPSRNVEVKKTKSVEDLLK